MSLKNQFITKQLNRKLQELKRHISPVNLSEVKTAGVLWKAGDRDVFNKMLTRLKEKGIRVSDLCCGSQRGPARDEVTLSLADFSFFGKLQNQKTADFIGNDFDLLIDISLAKGTECQFVRALSKAKFKAGWSETTIPDYFDLSIDIRKRKDPGYLAEQLIYYLNEINKK